MTIEDKRKVAKSGKNIQLIVAPKKRKIEKEGNKIIKQKLQLLRTERHEFPDRKGPLNSKTIGENVSH